MRASFRLETSVSEPLLSRLGVQLRPVTKDDWTFLRALYATTRARELALASWTPIERDSFLNHQFQLQRADYQARFSSDDHQIITRSGEPIGRFWLDRLESRWVIVDMSLLPGHRGGRIGTTILEQTFTHADAAHAPIVLTVGWYNPESLALCRRLGFLVRQDDGLHVTLERPPRPPGSRDWDASQLQSSKVKNTTGVSDGMVSLWSGDRVELRLSGGCPVARRT